MISARTPTLELPEPSVAKRLDPIAARPPIRFVQSPVGQWPDSHAGGLGPIEHRIQHVSEVALPKSPQRTTREASGRSASQARSPRRGPIIVPIAMGDRHSHRRQAPRLQFAPADRIE